MNDTTQKSRLPVIVTVVTAGLPMVLGAAHLCHLHSTFFEVLLPVAVISACCFWTANAKTSGKAWLRTGLAFVFAFVIQTIYLSWLHSGSFPQALLSRRAKEQQARIDEMRGKDTPQIVGESTSGSAKDEGVAFEWGYFEGSVYINPTLGFSIDLPQWESVRKFKKDIAQEEHVDYFFGQMNLFLFSKYPQSPDIRHNPEMWMAVYHVKEQSLESHIEEQNYVILEKGKISGKDIYTIRLLIQPKDHKTGRPLDHLPPIHRKFIIFKKDGLVGEIGILCQTDEEEKELGKILETIQLN